MDDNLKNLEPNSDEWLAALKKINPHQAEMAAAMVKRVGHKNACMACGDEPAQDHLLPGKPLRARLCNDCLAIQSAM